ncbi:MAG: chromosomal replication initiator protein DnaA [Spirochaetia bacterium]|nr:chromosomal replication initiator protein DnaA [Spirochaetia bacterium]
MYKSLWDQIIGEMRKSTPRGERGMYLDQLSYISSEEGILTIGTPSKFLKDRMENLGFRKKLEDAVSERAGSKIEVKIEIAQQELSAEEQKAPEKAGEPEELPKNHPALREEFTFSNFVVSTNNELAANAAMAISMAPGKSYNPLLIYGGVGLGKTHLMQAIGNEIYRRFPEKKVVYVTAEKFTNEFIAALFQHSTPAFKNKYRGVDVLLIDDIHFFQGKEQVQEELFNTFNALYEVNKQMVFTCDRHPSELKNLTERMKSRFMSGLPTDLKIPDYETRIAILKKKCDQQKIFIKDEVLEFISKNVTTSVRDLEAALTKIIAYSELIRKEVTLEVAKNQLSYLGATRTENVSIDRIIKAVAENFNISSSDIRGRKRTKNIAWPRQIAMYIINHLGEYSMNEIGNEFGKDHTTVIYAIQKVEDSIKSNPTLEPLIQKIEEEIREASEKG